MSPVTVEQIEKIIRREFPTLKGIIGHFIGRQPLEFGVQKIDREFVKEVLGKPLGSGVSVYFVGREPISWFISEFLWTLFHWDWPLEIDMLTWRKAYPTTDESVKEWMSRTATGRELRRAIYLVVVTDRGTVQVEIWMLKHKHQLSSLRRLHLESKEREHRALVSAKTNPVR